MKDMQDGIDWTLCFRGEGPDVDYLELKVCERRCSANGSVHAQPHLMLVDLRASAAHECMQSGVTCIAAPHKGQCWLDTFLAECL